MDAAGESDGYPVASSVIPKLESDGSATDVDMFSVSAASAVERTHYQPLEASAAFTNHRAISNQPTQETDAKSDTSFDPLFDDEPDADGEIDHSPKDGGSANQAVAPHQSGPVGVAVPDASSFGQEIKPVARSSQSCTVAPPKNAPPLLSSDNSATFSPDILMIAAIDGQIMLWDKRVHTPGKGVGRMWMSEKTPPWCVSVRAGVECGVRDIFDRLHRHVGLQMGHRSMQVDVMER